MSKQALIAASQQQLLLEIVHLSVEMSKYLSELCWGGFLGVLAVFIYMRQIRTSFSWAATFTAVTQLLILRMMLMLNQHIDVLKYVLFALNQWLLYQIACSVILLLEMKVWQLQRIRLALGEFHTHWLTESIINNTHTHTHAHWLSHVSLKGEISEVN